MINKQWKIWFPAWNGFLTYRNIPAVWYVECQSHRDIPPWTKLIFYTMTLTTRMNFNASSCMIGPRNWQPLFRTAVHRNVEICWLFWCSIRSSVTVRSAIDLTALRDRALPSTSSVWQLMTQTSFFNIGLVRWVTADVIPWSARGWRKSASWSAVHVCVCRCGSLVV